MRISNMRVGMRLAYAFSIILVIMIIMSSSVFLFTKKIQTNVDEILSQYLVKERLVEEWTELLYQSSGKSTSAITTNDAELRKNLLAAVKQIGVRVSEIQSTVTPMIHLGAGKQYLANIDSARANYYAKLKQGMAIADSGEYEKANDFVQAEFLPATNEYCRALTQLLNFQKGLIDDAHEKLNASTYKIIFTMLILSLAGIVFSALTAWFVTGTITHPLKKTVTLIESIANGDLTADIDHNSKDEIGLLITAIRTMVAKIGTTLHKVRTGATHIARAANEIDSGNQDLSSRTEEQAAALQQTAASMEEIKITVRQNADNAGQANDLAQNARLLALEGGKAAESTRVIMNAIQESSRAISEINSVITSIASQTNILALNAAVEAARAGEQGRGFAVVAGEVRNLAQRSSSAAQEIRSLIEETTAKVASGANLVMETNRKIENTIDSVTKVSDLMEEIKTAAEEQNIGIAQISQAITEMDTVTQQNAALVEEAAAGSSNLNEQAKQLSGEVEFFKIQAAKDGVSLSAPLAEARISAPVNARVNLSAREDSWESF